MDTPLHIPLTAPFTAAQPAAQSQWAAGISEVAPVLATLTGGTLLALLIFMVLKGQNKLVVDTICKLLTKVVTTPLEILKNAHKWRAELGAEKYRDRRDQKLADKIQKDPEYYDALKKVYSLADPAQGEQPVLGEIAPPIPPDQPPTPPDQPPTPPDPPQLAPVISLEDHRGRKREKATPDQRQSHKNTRGQSDGPA